MKGSDRTILIVLPLLALVIGLWLLVISPKRAELGDLQDKVDTLQSQSASADQEVAVAEQARGSFDKNYSALIDLGAAAPAEDDQATLVYDLASTANRNDVRFGSFELADTPTGADAAAATPTAPADPAASSSGESTTTESTDTTTEATGSTTESSTATTTTASVPATEATVSSLPLGTAVGPAGLPISNYQFSLEGTYFNATDFLGDLDSTVEVSETRPPVVHGRLLTIEGFSFSLEQLDTYPSLTANFAVTAYQVPRDQGLDAGATPAGPAPVGTTTDSTTTTAAPAAAVTP